MINLKSIIIRGAVLQFESISELKMFKEEIAAMFNTRIENISLTYEDESETEQK
ncbi:MAG TPA: hypothetical protein VN192_02795 [Flavobacterium sp.]|nr:hypothetical protein [Flavobacterium sp.]